MKVIAPIRSLALITIFAVFCCIQAVAESPKLRFTTWNLQWFPNGSPKELSRHEQDVRIESAASILRQVDPDILLLQEMKDYDACVRLAEAIHPQTYQVAICSAFTQGAALAKQQEAILAKIPAQAAWAEPWKSMDGIDLPRGFAFAWFKIHGANVGIYCVHLKSNAIRAKDKQLEEAKNVHKRELAIQQLLTHIHEMIPTMLPDVTSFIIGGDLNTNKDQQIFSDENSLKKLLVSGFRDCFAGMPLAQRITHPGKHPYPPATFDYLFGKNVVLGKPVIRTSDISDHLPLTCEAQLSP